ncbi:MAG TPA: sigma-70 family RNA polymerase sigma factor [Chitinophagaceae bacterium]
MKQFESISESALIEKIKAGEIKLFEILIRRNNPFLYKVGKSYGFGHQDVEDLMQETFIAAYQNLGKFEGRSSFKTWVVKIMINQCIKKAQKLSLRNESTMDIETKEKTDPMFKNTVSKDTYKVVVNRELSHIIGDAITQLPLDYRLVFSLRELNGMSTSETAEALVITEGNVKVRLNRARHMLRKMVEKMYTPDDIFEFNLVYCDSIVHKVMQSIEKLRMRDRGHIL